MLLKVDCLPKAVGKQPSIPLIHLGRKWTLNWWWWWWWWWWNKLSQYHIRFTRAEVRFPWNAVCHFTNKKIIYPIWTFLVWKNSIIFIWDEKEIFKWMTMSIIAYIIGFVGTVAHGNHGASSKFAFQTAIYEAITSRSFIEVDLI